jgi:hypothetical protein
MQTISLSVNFLNLDLLRNPPPNFFSQTYKEMYFIMTFLMAFLIMPVIPEFVDYFAIPEFP